MVVETESPYGTDRSLETTYSDSPRDTTFYMLKIKNTNELIADTIMPAIQGSGKNFCLPVVHCPNHVRMGIGMVYLAGCGYADNTRKAVKGL